MASGVSTGDGIRAALASFAADSPGNLYPAADSIRDDATLRTIVNSNGGTLQATTADMGMRFGSYETRDTDNDGIPDSYVLTLFVLHEKHQAKLTLTPEGIEKGAIEHVSDRR